MSVSRPIFGCQEQPKAILLLYTMPKIGSQFDKKIESTRAIVTKEEHLLTFLILCSFSFQKGFLKQSRTYNCNI